ncbi:MAG TPA: gene transfer agent family protein [Microvirga sp.]|jgi:hypothetical protein|nr:gene transfer agent family protein [Microvirga sp.]
MSADGSTSFLWADGEHRFRLAIGQLRELQDKTGTGPQALLSRLMDGTWRVDDPRETIRLGLIGGGMKPPEALVLVSRYVDARPLMESIMPARAILAAALMGDREDTVGKEEPEEAATEPTGSPSPTSTAPEPSSAGRLAKSTTSRSGSSRRRSTATTEPTPPTTLPPSL